MTFSGTTDKCTTCDKTVHFIDLLIVDGIYYHKTCFKCSHCNGLLVMSNYCSMEGVLYCKTHFDQLFKETGNYPKNLQNGKSDKPNGQAKAPSRLASFFTGTIDKCTVCHKTAYPLETVILDGENYHKSCFRCSPGGCFLTPSSYAAMGGVLFCKHHFAQLFLEKGCLNHIARRASMQNSTQTALESEDEPKPEDEPEDESKPEAESEEKSDDLVEQSQ